MGDYPDGYSRSLPSHTIELDPGYATFWQKEDDFSLGAGLASTSTFTISGAGYIHYIDTLSVFFSPVGAVRAILKRATTTLDAQASLDYIKFNPRENPSIYWLDGETIDVAVYNLSGVDVTAYIYINGTKIKMPAGFVRV